MSTITKACECCGKSMQVRSADVARGWGRFCSKSCKAAKQESRTGQYRAYRDNFPSAMTEAELAGGGYGDSERDAGQFGDDKW